MKITEIISEQSISAELASTEKKRALAELSTLLAQGSRGVRADDILEVLTARERVATTGIGEGVAIPHGKVPGLPGLVASFGRSTAGVDFRAIDGRPTHLFFTLFAPENSAGAHLKALARISRIFKNPSFRDAILKAASADEVYRLIEVEDAKY